MKRILSTVLVLMFILSAVSCASVLDETDKSSTSSSTEGYTGFIKDYAAKNYGIEMKSEGEVLSVGSNTVIVGDSAAAQEYGIDMSDYSAGGYLVRIINKNAVVFGADAEGVDAGSRYFVKYCLSKDGITNDNTYVSEGASPKVGKITIGGADISLYTIVKPENASEADAFAADKLSELIERASGVKLPVTTSSSSKYLIKLIQDASKDNVLGDEGYSITVKGTVMTIEGGKWRGCIYGVYDIAGTLGFRFLSKNYSYLYESELIEFKDGYSVHEDGGQFMFRQNFDEARNTPFSINDFDEDYLLSHHYTGSDVIPTVAKYGYSAPLYANHGMVNYLQSIYPRDEIDQWIVCFAGDQKLFDELYQVVTASFDARIAAGQQLGREIRTADIGRPDTENTCKCKECRAIMNKYGHVASAPMMDFSNRFADRLKADGYHDVMVNCLAYYGTNRPPKNMELRDNVGVSYCFYVPCNQHGISGKDCINGSRYTNIYYAQEYEGWKQLTDNVFVWYYPCNYNYSMCPAPNVLVMYEDFRFLADNGGCAGVFVHSNDIYGKGFEDLQSYISYNMMWNSDITYDEFLDMIYEFCTLYYGDGGKYIYEYLFMWERAGDLNNEKCWSGLWHAPMTKLNYEYFGANYDHFVELFDKAVAMANTKKQQTIIETLSLHMHFNGIAAVYKDRYTNGSADEKAVIAERYTWLYNYIKDNNIDMGDRLAEREYLPEELDLNVNPLMWLHTRTGDWVDPE